MKIITILIIIFIFGEGEKYIKIAYGQDWPSTPSPSSSNELNCTEDCSIPPYNWFPSAPCFEWGCRMDGKCGEVSMCPYIMGCMRPQCTLDGCRYNVSTCYSCQYQILVGEGDCYEHICNTTDVLVINRCSASNGDPCSYSKCNTDTKQCGSPISLCTILSPNNDPCTIHKCDSINRQCTETPVTCDDLNQNHSDPNCTIYKCDNSKGGCILRNVDPYPEKCIVATPHQIGVGVIAGIVIGSVAFVGVAGFAAAKFVNKLTKVTALNHQMMNGANSNPLFQENPTSGDNPLYATTP